MDDGQSEEIEKVRAQEQAGASAAKREAAEKKRQLKIFGHKALRAKKAKDARAFAAQLRAAQIHDGSLEWKKAWEYFYD